MRAPAPAGGEPFARRPALLALLVAVVAAALGVPEAAPAGTGERPNVVVVMTDDQRVDDMAVMGKTRRILGRRGTTFETALATFPLCCPSRATYLTGQYAHNHGVRDNNPPQGGAAVFRDSGAEAQALPVAMQNAGYRTAWIGKYLNGYPRLAREQPPYVPPGWNRWAAQAGGGLMFGWKQLLNGTLRTWGKRPRDYYTDVVARQGASFIRSSAAKGLPFFLTVATLAPHGEQRSFEARRNPRPAPRHRHRFERRNLQRPPAFNELDVSDKPAFIQAQPRLGRGERQRVRRWANDRLASLLAVDDLVERLVAELRSARQLRTTVFIFTSDNGFMLGEHRLRHGKSVFYEEAARVPLLVRGPGFPRGARIAAPVANVDLAPTILDAAGAEPLIEPDGVSLLDVAADPGAFEDRAVLLESLRGAGLRTRDFTYAEYGEPADETELYDLAADPFQLTSAHADPAYAAERALLAARLAALRDCQGASCH